MDRDAGSLSPFTPADAVPPWAPATVRMWGLIGVGLIMAAVLLGLASMAMGDSSPDALNTARLFLVFVGVITAGSAVSMRPDLWWTWGIGSLACVLAVPGLPSHWDSFQLLFAVIAGLAASGAALCVLPPRWRYAVATAVLLYHFSGIFMATTSPPSTPWLSDQLFRRIYNPYLQFVYLRNAYHFYSPEPGPASILVFLLKTETGEDPDTHKKQYQTKWLAWPKRPTDIRDPMGLGYYRLLSLNEQIARGSHILAIPTVEFEKSEMWSRRFNVSNIIPFHPAEPKEIQYKLPNPDVARYLLPSYTSHVILENTPDKATAAKTTVKVYRLEHRDIPADQFAHGQNPYHPGTYRPFFLGEFDAFGNLVNPQEELLYWLLPILPRQPRIDDKEGDPFKKEYYDYLSVHALKLSRDEVLKANENDGQVFNWSQLR